MEKQLKTVVTNEGTKRALMQKGLGVIKPMVAISHCDSTNKNETYYDDATTIIAEDVAFNAPHTYGIYKEGELVGEVNFQRGPIKDNGYNGVTNEDLINIVKDRLEHFQNSEFNCSENAYAIDHLNKALWSLESRTKNRKARNVEGTYKK